MDNNFYINNLHYFSIKKKNYLFEKESGRFFKIDKLTYNKLKNVSKENIQKYISEKFIGKFENIFKDNEKILFPDDNEILNKYKFNPIYNLNIVVSQVCNLRCKYCYSLYYRNFKKSDKSIFMNKNTAKEIIEGYLNYNLEKGSKDFTISFAGGGEPLTNYEIIKYFINYLNKQIENYSNVNLKYKISTNGLLLDYDKLNYFRKNNVKIKISIDGPKYVTNSNRVDYNGLGIYDKLIDKIKLSQEVLDNKNLYAAITFTRNNINLTEILKHVMDLGFINIKFQFASDKENFITLNDFSIIKKEIIKLSELYLNYLLNYNYEKDFINFETFVYIIKQLIYKPKKLMPCVGGVSDLSVDTSGNVFLCTRTMGINDYKIGKFDINNINEWRNNYYRNFNINHRPLCQSCWALYYCCGYCNHLNILFNNSPMIPYEPMCNIRKLYYEIGIYLIDELMKKRKDILKKIISLETY